MHKEGRSCALWRGLMASFALVSVSGCAFYAPSMQPHGECSLSPVCQQLSPHVPSLLPATA